MILREAFDYRFSRLDPTGDHIDPPSIAVYETLVAKGSDGRPRPLLARDWNVSDDGLEVTLRLRAGARFHSGEPCDAREIARAQVDRLGGSRLDANAEVERGGQHEPPGKIRVLADQVHPARRPDGPTHMRILSVKKVVPQWRPTCTSRTRTCRTRSSTSTSTSTSTARSRLRLVLG